MRAFAAVFRMEMAEKRNVFIAAAVTALLPFILALYHPGSSPGEVRSLAAYTLLIIFVEVMALMFGVTMIGSDLSSGRLSFYFARPIKPLSLWCGKLTAALVAIAASAVIILGPVVISGDFAWPTSDWLEVRNFLLFTIAVLLVTHAISIIRCRSSWLPLDLAGATIFCLLLWYSLRSLMMAGDRWLGSTAQILACLILVAISIAGAAQLVRGRTDRALSHATFSITLWSILILMAIGCDGYSWWFTHPNIGDLQSVAMTSAPAGGWVGVSGSTRHRASFLRSVFLLQPGTGRTVGVGLAFRPPLTSPSGVMVGFRSDGSVWYFDTRTTNSSPRDLPLRTDQAFPGRDAPDHAIGGCLSDDGSRLALLNGASIGVYSLPDAKLLAATNISDSHYLPRLFFPSDNDLEIVEAINDGKSTKVTVLHLNTTTKHLERSTLSMAGTVESIGIFADTSGNRLSLWNLGPPRSAALVDVASGQVLLRMKSSKRPNFLDGSRFPVDEQRNNATVFNLVDRDGKIVSSLPLTLKTEEVASVSRLTLRGNVLVRLTDYSTHPAPTFSVLVINPASGQILRRIANVIPAVNAFWSLDPRALPPSASEYFIDSTSGSLLQIDPDTGTRRVLVKGELQIPFD